MGDWEDIVDELAETPLLTESQAETLVLQQLQGQSLDEVASQRGILTTTAEHQAWEGRDRIKDLRESLRKYELYFENGTDLREGDILHAIPDGWRETQLRYAVMEDLGIAVYRLPDGSFTRVKIRNPSQGNRTAYEIETVGSNFVVRPEPIDWSTFDDIAFNNDATTDGFRQYVDHEYSKAVKNAVQKWLFETPSYIEGASLARDPLSLDVDGFGFVEELLSWGAVPEEDFEQTKAMKHEGEVAEHAVRFKESHNYLDAAIESFPKRVQQALDEATDGEYMVAFEYDIT
jgi:hypothetical protein